MTYLTNKFTRVWLLPMAAGLILAGCATAPDGGYSNSGGSFGSTQSRRQAEELSQLGDHEGAALAYLDLANAAQANQQTDAQHRYLILTARERYLANDASGAERLLAQVKPVLSDINYGTWSLVSAEVKLGNGQPNQALKALDKIPLEDPDYDSPRTLLLRAESLFQLGRPESAVDVLMQRETDMRSRTDKLDNQRLIYKGLQTSGSSLPKNPSAADEVVNGWLVLGYLSYQQRNNYANLRQALRDWRQAYPAHPAARGLVPELLDQLGAMLNYPDRVAVLLPLSGRQKATAEAIREGFLAAHFELGDVPERPEILIYDTAGADGALGAMELAVRDRVDFIVGPLLKESVDEVASMSPPATTLALNNHTMRSAGGFGRGFYQFALSPEDEARQVARRALAEGHRNALVMIPDNAWGERLLNSFNEELRAQGGFVLRAVTYSTDSADFATAIQNMLLLDESNQRHQQLDQIIGRSTEFEPRMRQDADFIFLAANAKTAKLVRPQLRYYYAGKLPTYSTSAVFVPGGRAEPDLRDINFPDSPWVLGIGNTGADFETVLVNRLGRSSKRRLRFYAMGHDAYRLMPLLNKSRANIETPVNGLSGKLTMDKQNRVRRELSWAYIGSNGRPRPLPETPRLILDSPGDLLTAE